MARRRYRRYYRRRGKKWSTRLNNFSGAQSAAASGTFVIYQNLCQNPAQSVDTISQLYTVKNIDCSIELSAGGTSVIENLQAYVMYIPQGYIPTGVPSAYANAPFEHPEWIMAHRYYGSPQVEYQGTQNLSANTPGFPPLKLRTRMARKLDTGDRVIVIILGSNTSASASAELTYSGLVKYNTKAN